MAGYGGGALKKWNDAVSEFASGTIACRVCGELLPAGGDDESVAFRRAHYDDHDKARGVQIDPEFKALIPALSADEYAALEASILAEGCRDALVIWRSTIVDGHNRFEICQRHGIPFDTIERDFDTREDVIVWMIRNQLARRNVEKFVRAELVLRMTTVIDAIKAKAKANQTAVLKQGDSSPVLPNLAKREDAVNTRAELAKLADVSNGTLSKVQTVIAQAPEEVKAKARAGEISIHRAEELTKALQGKAQSVVDLALRVAGDNPEKVDILNDLYKSGQRDGSNETFAEIAASGGFHHGKDLEDWLDFASADVRAIKAALVSVAKYHQQIARDVRIAGIVAQGAPNLAAMPERFSVLYADVPWEYEYAISDSRRIDNQYPTMPLEVICALPVASIATDPAVLFFWATSPKLDEAMTVIRSWGFTYKTCLIWDKDRMGMGYYARQQHELLLIATRGAMPTPQPDARPASVIRIRRSETHSEKPAEFRDLIGRMYPDFNKIELFSRVAAEGWYVWGYESQSA